MITEKNQRAKGKRGRKRSKRKFTMELAAVEWSE
jgi:hypothetical protein